MTSPVSVSRLHLAAIRALLDDAFAALQIDGRYEIYEGDVTASEDQVVYPYLVIWPPPADRSSGRTINSTTGAAVTTTQITAAGTSNDEVLHALDIAATALDGVTPTIEGRRFQPIRQEPGGLPPQPSKDNRVSTKDGLPVYYSFIIVTLRSHPAA